MNPTTRTNAVKMMSAEEAVEQIPSNATVAFLGAGGGIAEPTAVIEALAKRYRETKKPRDLTLYYSTGLGDRGDRGLSPLAQSGLVKRAIGGHWDQSPRLAEMVARNEIEGYNFPMGVMSQLLRAAAAGHPGLLTHVGIGTFIDPRQTGGRLNERTTEELIEIFEIQGKEWLFYPAIRPDVAIIRATTADTEGYLTMEDEITFLDILPMAQAVKNNGGMVIAQVQRLAKAGTLHPKDVKIPGYLVDAVVVVSEQPQLYSGALNRFMSGDFIAEIGEIAIPPLNERKVIARRALFEICPGDVGNVGVGISDGIGIIAQEEGVGDEFTLTVETGPIGGVTAQGIFFGASINNRAVIDMPAQFDFYDGGGLDICFLSFAEVDQAGNVNVSRFNGKIVGTGGFINITSNSKKVIFSGTLTAGGLQTEIVDGSVKIHQEGRFQKFVPQVEEITFNGTEAMKQGKEVLYITERAVFKLTPEGLELIEIAPGVDIEKDILSHMGFQPRVSPNLKTMDLRLFLEEPMGIREQWLNQTLRNQSRNHKEEVK
ncbi:coenzyme a transferase [Bacillus sp. OxB-1]|uniref:acyl CoA:acetate/3-ketoacid CoA transferase n=1 Tax=Bacillus sp. (strain OxB-1) TaxID=98228 RepID=UPI000581CC53|nr:acyl CoA:acetate/3-ketoacid CoA transferase [Bacillus sp. OxB-1]BAQ11241.1 coenzyme a transferase [Bacillus sp. OxB-1]